MQKWKELFKIAEKYRISLNIISGITEAQYCASGSLVNLKISDSPTLIVDIGGGSTEFIFLNNNRIVDLQSFNIGVVRLTEQFIVTQPADQSALEKLSFFLDKELTHYLSKFSKEQSLNVIGIAGTPTSLVAAKLGKFEEEKIHGADLSILEIEKWIYDLRICSIKEIETRYNFGKRSDIILAGTILLQKVLGILGTQRMIVSTKGVRYGLALEMLKKK